MYSPRRFLIGSEQTEKNVTFSIDLVGERSRVPFRIVANDTRLFDDTLHTSFTPRSCSLLNHTCIEAHKRFVVPRTRSPARINCHSSEENVWKLCQDAATRHGSEIDHCYVAFVSNPWRSVPLWRQRAGKDEDKLVVWVS